MRILYIGNFELPDGDAASVRVLGNGYSLRAAGVEVIYLDAQRNCDDDILQSRHIVQEFPVYSRQIKKSKIKDYFKCMFSIKHIIDVIQNEKNVDCVVLYNYSSIALLMVLAYCRKKNIKVVSDCTEWYSSKNYKFPLSFFSAVDTFLRMRIVLKQVDGIITVSSYLDRYYKKRNTIRIPFLVKCEEYQKIQMAEDFDAKKLNILCIGSPLVAKEKIDGIVDAVKKSKNSQNVVLRIVGMTKDQFFDTYGSETLLGDNNSIVFMGRVPRERFIGLVKAADFFVFVRERTRQNMAGFPTKFVESVSSGTPVITTDTSDLVAVSQENCLPTVFIKDSDDLCSFLSKPLSELKEYKRMSDKQNMLFDCSKKSRDLGEWFEKLKR